MTLQTTIELYQPFGIAGQDYTGPGQARVVRSGYFANVGEYTTNLNGILAITTGVKKGYSFFPNSSQKISTIVGFFMDEKLKQNAPSSISQGYSFKSNDPVTILSKGDIVVQTIGTLNLNSNIYVYVGSNSADVGKLQSTDAQGVLIGGPDFNPDGTNALPSPIRVIKASDGLALVSVNYA